MDSTTTVKATVCRIIESIPYGRVTSYGAIARAAGLGRGARRVGWIIARLDEDHDLPCHRVVNAKGFLSGGWAFGHPAIMRALLEEEGVAFVDEYVVDLERHLWVPDRSAPAYEVDHLEDIP